MAPVSDVELEADSSRPLSKEDCVCPICLEIFMEPVTLPCSHTFCKVCFLESVDKATLCCPLCRKRVSTWARHQTRKKSLVNESLWKNIQRCFPRSEERRQGGGEEHMEVMCFRRLCEPGALRQEYEDQVSKLSEEKRVLDEQERQASEELIQRLLAEEEELQKEQRQIRHEDERLARLLSQELNSADQRRPPEATVKKKPVGQMDRFLSPLSKGSTHISPNNKEYISVPQTSSSEPQTDQSQPQDPDLNDIDQSAHGDRPPEGGVLSEWEAELQRRRQQEEEDLRVALQLQRELDRQQRLTDRSKGSEDAYELRTPRRAGGGRGGAATATVTAGARARKRSRSSSSSSAPPHAMPPHSPCPHTPPPHASQTLPVSPALRGARQTTLTDLFNLHS
ncbi:unnamed protein product [Knipowitschia caucasica]